MRDIEVRYRGVHEVLEPSGCCGLNCVVRVVPVGWVLKVGGISKPAYSFPLYSSGGNGVAIGRR